MTSVASEHVVGLDGLAVIVHKSNPVMSLSKDELSRIFSGATTDWSQLGGAAKGKTGPIALYARDEKSGTFDSFKQMVLDPRPLANSARRYEDSGELSDAVANDPSAIGFIGLPYVRNAKPLSLGEKGATTLLPNRFTVATEDYVLSRRLYLYSASAPTNPNVMKFIEFAKSGNGQAIVAQQGFIEQTIRAQDKASESGTRIADQPQEYQRATANATRLSLNFRFRSGSKELDNKAIPDLDRVASFLADMRIPTSSVMLFGFADARGRADENLRLSRERAQTVATEFISRGITPPLVTGFGAALPVASNDSPEGQEKNRRVEIWVKR
jgi:phosphate transport system substrate-binding protein